MEAISAGWVTISYALSAWSISSSNSVQSNKRCCRKRYALVNELLLSTQVINQDFSTVTFINMFIAELSSMSNSTPISLACPPAVRGKHHSRIVLFPYHSPVDVLQSVRMHIRQHPQSFSCFTVLVTVRSSQAEGILRSSKRLRPMISPE
jgi:hypothetical protein